MKIWKFCCAHTKLYFSIKTHFSKIFVVKVKFEMMQHTYHPYVAIFLPFVAYIQVYTFIVFIFGNYEMTLIITYKMMKIMIWWKWQTKSCSSIFESDINQQKARERERVRENSFIKFMPRIFFVHHQFPSWSILCQYIYFLMYLPIRHGIAISCKNVIIMNFVSAHFQQHQSSLVLLKLHHFSVKNEAKIPILVTFFFSYLI